MTDNVLDNDWVPYGPGGSPMEKLAAPSEAYAWRNLIQWAERQMFHYADRSGLSHRGYTVKNKKGTPSSE